MSDQPETKPKTLVQKLCEVMAKVKYIQKLGRNEAQSYRYATEADVADALRGELAERNIFIFPNMVKNERIKLERMNYKGELKTSYATDLEMDWTFVDGDSGETHTCRIPGCSESPGDKGVYVAMTGSEKYLLMKSFLIPTGDDPESDSNEPQGTAKDAKAIGEAKVAKLKEKVYPSGAQVPGKAIPTLFFTEPPSHNGFFAEWVNIKEFLGQREDIEDSLRMVFTAHRAKQTKSGTTLVPTGEMQALTEKLVGEMGLNVKKLEANA